MNLAATIIAMLGAGCTAEQMASVAAAFERERLERAAQRRATRASHIITDRVVTSQASQASQPSQRVTLVTRRDASSPGALRTRRWRERLILRGTPVDAASPVGVTANVTTVTPVTLVTPTPDRTPLKGVHRPAGGASSRGKGEGQDRRQRQLPLMRSLAGGMSTPSAEQLFVRAEDPAFAVLGAMRGKGYPVNRAGGWWFPGPLVTEARQRVSADSERATGPPMAANG